MNCITLFSAYIILFCYVRQITATDVLDKDSPKSVKPDEKKTKDEKDVKKDALRTKKSKKHKTPPPEHDEILQPNFDNDQSRYFPEVTKEPKEFKNLREGKESTVPKKSKKKSVAEKDTSQEIDEFLDKVLKSHNIDKIAELIAKKAADKILRATKTRSAPIQKQEEKDEKESSGEKEETDTRIKKKEKEATDTRSFIKKIKAVRDDIKKPTPSKGKPSSQPSLEETEDNLSHKIVRDSGKHLSFRESDVGSVEERSPSIFQHSFKSISAEVRKRASTSSEDSSSDESDSKKTSLNSNERAELLNMKEDIQPPATFKLKSNSSNIESNEAGNNLPASGDTKSIVRKEGSKLFAFVESPDYDEYHEKLSSMLKSVQNKSKRRAFRSY